MAVSAELEAKRKATDKALELRRVLDAQRQDIEARRAAELAAKRSVAQQQVRSSEAGRGRRVPAGWEVLLELAG